MILFTMHFLCLFYAPCDCASRGCSKHMIGKQNNSKYFRCDGNRVGALNVDFPIDMMNDDEQFNSNALAAINPRIVGNLEPWPHATHSGTNKTSTMFS